MAIITTHPGGPYYVWRQQAMGAPPPAQFDEWASPEGILYHDWQHGVPRSQAATDYLLHTVGGAGSTLAPPPSAPPSAQPAPILEAPPPPPPPPPPEETGDQPVIGTSAAEPLSGEALQIANTLLNEGLRLNAPWQALAAILCAASGETAFGTNANTYGYNGVCCWGVLQGGTDQWSDPHDVTGQALAFYTGRGPQGQTDFHTGAINFVKEGVTDPEEIAVRVEVPSIWPSDAYANNDHTSSAARSQKYTDMLHGLLPGLGKTAPPPTTSAPQNLTTPTGFDTTLHRLDWAGDFENLWVECMGGANEAAKMSDDFWRQRLNAITTIGW